MRIYRRKEFLELPAGTFFCKGKNANFGGIQVKGETLPWSGVGDFYAQDLQWVEAEDSGQAFARLDEMLESGASYPMEDAEGRDGCFDEDEVFLVYERADLEALERLIRTALALP